MKGLAIQSHELWRGHQQREPTLQPRQIVTNDQPPTHVRRIPSKPAPDLRVETHYAYHTLINGELQGDLLTQPRGVSIASLQLEQERDPSTDQVEHLMQGRQLLACLRQSLAHQQRRGRCLHFESEVAHSIQVAVVKHDGGTVTGEPNVAFDSSADANCRLKRGETVFRNSPAKQAAMGKPTRAGV